MDDLKHMSNGQLISELWDATLPAWLGASTGSILAIGSLFWRFVMAPWHVVIAYSDSEIVWGRLGIDGLFRGPEPPPIPMTSNLIPACIFVLGVMIVALSTARWRRVKNELVLRRTPQGHQP